MKNSELAQLVLDLSESSIKLYDWQKNWLDDESRFRIMLKSRAVGGSFLIALESFLLSLLNNNHLTLLISFSMRQSLELFKKVKDWIKKWENIRVSVEDTVYTFTALLSETKTSVEFPNGSRIISLPNNPDAIRGYRADMVYVDEAGMFRDDFSLKTAIIPTLAGKHGRLSLISTPKGKRGWFYEAWTSEVFSKHRIHYSMSPHITKEDLEGMKASLTPLEWAQEMELEFLDEQNVLFPYETILKCMIQDKPYPYIVPGETKIENSLYIGIDFGRYRDSTVIIVLEKIGDLMRVVFLKEFQKVSMTEQKEYISKLISVLSPAKVMIDKTGLGIPMHDFLSQQFTNVEGVTFTAAKKEAMILNLYNYMNAGKVIIPEHEELIRQLRQFQRIQTPSGLVKYTAPEGSHDDYVIALALAVYAATQFEQKLDVSEVWTW